MNDQGNSLERRRLLRWLGAAALVLPGALAACANSNAPRRQARASSDIRGSDHRDGHVNIFERHILILIAPITAALRSNKKLTMGFVATHL